MDFYGRCPKFKRGDKDAENKLDGLWRLAVPRLRELEKSGKRLVITECPHCGAGFDPELSECPICHWSKYDSGYHQEFDSIIRGRDR